jgi:hypothetical protein
MELTHQLTPMLRTLRLSGVLETLEVRHRQAVDSSPPSSSSSPRSCTTRSSAARRANSVCACGAPRSIPPRR